MRSFILAGLVGVVTASTAATVKKVSSSTDDAFFATGDAPHCKVSSAGHTVVQFTSALHPSYKCTHNTDNTACSCVSNHPTHHHGGCREFKHTDGSNHIAGGDCTDTGVNPVNGAWSTWTAQGSCSASCGDGSQTYTRTCDGIVNGGNDCSQLDGGNDTKTESCKIMECPVNGAWSGWTAGSCSTTCGAGTMTSTRTCDGIAHGGNDCSQLDGGSNTKTESCNIMECPDNDPKVGCFFSCTHRNTFGWNHPGNYATIAQCKSACSGYPYFSSECPHSGGNVHCWCLTEQAMQQSKDAGDEISWGNCDDSALTTGEADGMTSTAQNHCNAPNNNNVHFLTELGQTYALGGNCRSAVYENN